MREKSSYERSTGPGWDSLVDPLVDECEQTGVRIDQIKEKFGRLRFYISAETYGDPRFDGLYQRIDAAEHASGERCEECGAPAKLRSRHGWLKTLCDEHGAGLDEVKGPTHIEGWF